MERRRLRKDIRLNLYYPDWDSRANHTELYPQLRVITSQPIGHWFGSSPTKPTKRVKSRVHRLCRRAHPHQPIIVIYSIPNRDLGHYSRGGHKEEKSYLKFIREITAGIGDYNPIIIFEPDAIPHISNMKFEDGFRRLQLIKKSLQILQRCNGRLYVDMGNPKWLKPNQVKRYIDWINEPIDGFVVNTSNYWDLKTCHQWGDKVSKMVNLHYLIDTSRNGVGSLGTDDWCNPPNRALGVFPTTRTSSEYCEAYLWIKVPGESDGTLNGGPKAGRFFLEQALSLIENVGR
jgi:endoglucanase|tara:strand:- start:8 stop:874 length:867 start_codon:yes stop_codon:yes gene_type:complete